jgi:hypothetical protein
LKDSTKLWLGFAAGVTVGVLMAGNASRKKRMPNAKAWQQIFTENEGQIEAAGLMARVEKRYDELVAQSGVFEEKALQGHLLENILPVLSLYQVWRADGLDQKAALASVDALYESQYKNKIGKKGLVLVEGILKNLPGGFGTFKWMLRRIMIAGFPAPGFELTFLPDDDSHFGFDIQRCFYQDIVTHYGAPELTASFCQVDNYSMEALPANIHWTRTGTLGTGAACCDFRWQYIPKGFVSQDQQNTAL